ncbi:predicted protein [Histoplasma capsulatum H143]|uniref:Uncharacterized protein n=1 Tax=Ajellomyces capsulatus (strain H143) TaxID=544712 RepID=C6HLD7_AJECH|nr:predicted protein [Histoplasma capsulatum H143]
MNSLASVNLSTPANWRSVSGGLASDLSSLLSVGPVRTTTLGPNTRETTGGTVRTTYKLWHIRFCSKKFSVIGETGENKSKQLQFIEEALLQVNYSSIQPPNYFICYKGRNYRILM